MKEGKHEKSKFRIVEKYSVLILIATLLMSIGYAEMSGINLSVAANVKATVQDGVFITEVTRTAYEGADITNSKINSYAETTMNNTVVLGSSSDSTITYNVWLYNNSDKDHVFIGITKDEELYKDANITYSTDLVPYGTVIEAGQNLDFNITFSYVGEDTDNNTLNSILNFRFMEVPKLEVSSAGDIAGIYPGQTKEATFTVTNFDSQGINGVPLDYTMEATIYDANGTEVTEPITATICDTSGTAVTKEVSMPKGEETTHTYKLKLAWEASNNSADYANKTYSYKIKVVATPNATATEKKYDEYTLTKETATADITTAPFYFVTDPTSVETTTVEMADNKAAINLTVSNNDGKNYNTFETKYTIALDNADFTLYVNGIEYANNIAENIQLGSGDLINSVEAIELKPKITSTTLTSEEICNITIKTTSPYVKTETIKIIATDKTGPTAPEITGGSSTYATSQTISVSKEATDVGTGVKYYQYIVDSDGQEIATTATGDVANGTSHTFSTNYEGYYVYFRAVDAVGNVGEWSNSQMLYIDINPPTVSAKATESEEIKEDTDSTFDVYFNISENGKAPITSEVYTDTSNSNQVVTNTSELAVGEHIIKCTVTKENGLTASAEKTIVVTSAMPEVTFRASNDSYEDSYGIGYEKTGSWIDIPEDVEIDYNETVWMIRNHGTIITSETEWTEVYNETNYGSGAADVLDSPVFAYAIDGEQTPYCNVHLKLVDTSGNIYYFMSDFTVNTTVTLPDSDTYIGALSGMVIPEGVIAVKIVSDCADSWIPPDPDGYVVCDYCGEYVCGSDTEYFSVTPGATYSLSQEGVGWTSRVYFSSSINSRSPYATLDCPE